MKIRDLKKVKLNLRVVSQASDDRVGTIIKKEKIRGLNYYWIHWDGDTNTYSGFFENDCDCEVIGDAEVLDG